MRVINLELSGIEELQKTLERFRGVPAVKVLDLLNDWRQTISGHVDKNLSGDVLGTRTGRLRRSVNSKQNLTVVQTSDTSFVVQFQNEVEIYAIMHETGAEASGGVLKPSNSAYLAVPLGKRRLSSTPVPLSSIPKKEKFVVRSKYDPRELVLMHKKAKNKAVPIALLKKEIKVKKRDWFYQAVVASKPELLARLRQV